MKRIVSLLALLAACACGPAAARDGVANRQASAPGVTGILFSAMPPPPAPRPLLE